MDQELQQRGQIKPQDQVFFVSRQPISVPGSTNRLKLHRALDLPEALGAALLQQGSPIGFPVSSLGWHEIPGTGQGVSFR